MPAPMFTAEDSLYQSTQNYSNLHFWFMSPSSTRTFGPGNPPRFPGEVPRLPQRFPTGDDDLLHFTPRLPPIPCDASEYYVCTNNAFDKLERCFSDYREAMKAMADELAPLVRPLKSCWNIWSKEMAECKKKEGCGAGNCTKYDFCCPLDTEPCISATKGNQCLLPTTCSKNEQISASCGCICKAGYTRCDGECVDLQNDHRYCGSCSHSCMSESCEGGQCKCPPDKPIKCDFNPAGGFSFSITQCSNLQDDKYNCGGCTTKGSDHRCGKEQQCYMGTCECVPKQNSNGVWYLPSKCGKGGKECVDLLTNGGNCGVCGKVCTGDTYCINGKCGCPYSSAPDLCGDKCVNFKKDKDNCGTCGTNCSSCANGACCPLGYGPCDDVCCKEPFQCCPGPGNDRTLPLKAHHCEDKLAPSSQCLFH